MTQIKFGTDGWRAIIAKEFTTENVARVAHATSLWIKMKSKKNTPSVVVGHDCRFAGELFTDTVAKVLASNGVKVFLAKGFVSTPMVSLGIVKKNADLGVVITASHNPPSYNGYKLKGSYGGPLLEAETKEVENLLPEVNTWNLDNISISDFEKKGLIEWTDLESLYCEHVESHFPLEKIRNSDMQFAFDAMYGSGQNVMRRLFPDITHVHCEHNPLFDNIPPEPLLKNLGEFSEIIQLSENIDCGLAVDGDADRIALFNHEGKYIDSHHIILLLIHYMVKYKKQTGKVVTGTSSTVKINKLCKHYNLPLDIVPIGFKHICSTMLKENVIVGGEESGGIAVSGHIPERDGIWNGIIIWELMTQTKKSLQELIDEIYSITGSFAFERSDLKIDESLKQKIVKNCKENKYKEFGKYKVQQVNTIDGFKYFFNDSEWLMVRPSGTEPLLRTYAESHSREEALAILKAGYDVLMNS